MTSIRRALVVSVSAAALTVSALTFGTIYVAVRHQLYHQFDRELLVTSQSLAGLTKVDNGKLEIDLRDEGYADFRRKDRKSYFQILDGEGKLALSSDDHATPLLNTDALPTGGALYNDLVLPDGRTGRLVAIRSTPEVEEPEDHQEFPQATIGALQTVWVVVAIDSAPVTNVLTRLAIAMGGAFVVMTGALLLIVPKLVARGLKPLGALADQTSRIDATNLSSRFDVQSLPTELRPIAAELNASLKRLNDAFERERQFAGNAAHELRTPLAAIRANADVALKWPDVEQLKASMSDVQHASVRMQSLVERLLELSRLGANLHFSRSRVDLAEIVLTALKTAAPIMAARGICVRSELGSESGVCSHADLLPSLVSNVVSNAAKHATPASEIEISIRSGDGTELMIENATADLTPADLDVMFTPLWTKSSDRSQAGAGLGLALVAGYARALDIEIASSLEQGRFRLVFRFPKIEVQ